MRKSSKNSFSLPSRTGVPPVFAARTVFYVYIIRSQRLQRYYVGSTEVVEKRLQEHNAGKSESTRAGTPWELIYTECFTTRSEAMLRERKIKARGIRRYLSDLGAARHASSG
ncbi:MAG TPA: GIY-YIG nuclease family protein [Anaerolineales bacterium]|nr:GIY-YIG nuclease family protein [Anaerolineales bacterium]